MKNENLDYLKSMSKKEFFVVDVINAVLGLVILVMGVISIANQPTVLSYAIMFGAGAIILFLNVFKSFKKKSSMGFVYLILGLVFGAISVMSIMTLIIQSRG